MGKPLYCQHEALSICQPQSSGRNRMPQSNKLWWWWWSSSWNREHQSLKVRLWLYLIESKQIKDYNYDDGDDDDDDGDDSLYDCS